MDSQSEEAQQKERIEKLQTYRLVRENVLEHHEQLKSDQRELMRCQLQMYENMQVSDTGMTTWCQKLSAEDIGNFNEQLQWS